MNAKNLSLKIGDTDMDYIRFGSGSTPLIMLPGLGDSLRTVKGMAQDNDYKSLFIDTAEKTYTEKKLRTYRPMYPFLCATTRPKSLERFLIQADACLTHDASAELYKITCPTLVIGGGQDRIVGTYAARELADGIRGSIFKEYPELGHGAYEEASDFNDTVLDFLLNGEINA